MIKGFYINLESQKAKALAMEHQIAAFNLLNYNRFEALTADSPTHPECPLKGGEKGCFLSHLQLLKNCSGQKEILHVYEDDVTLSSSINDCHKFILSQNPESWDLIYSDIFVQPDLNNFFNFLEMWEQYQQDGNISIFDLKNRSLTGATSYFVNPNSISKCAQLLEQNISSGLPYDLLLRQLIDKGFLKAFALFPFFSYPKCDLGHSDIRTNTNLDLAFAKLREAFFVEADLKKILKDMEGISKVQPSPLHVKIYGEYFKIVANDLR